MSKFASRRPQPRGAVQTSGSTHTHEGGRAFSRDAESDLFLLAITNLVGEDTFYETADVRDKRFRDLIHAVTRDNPSFISGGTHAHPFGFASYLRTEMLMRSASQVLAAEYVAAGGPHGRRVVDAVCQRPDEPAELLAYWLNTRGRTLPMPLKRGLADAVARLYTQQAALKYDSANAAVRMSDVIELVHPVPRDEAQGQLFKYLLDAGHKRENPRLGAALDALRTERALRAMAEEDRRDYARRHPEVLATAGYTWERLSSWIPGGMDAEAWQLAIPNMRPMALIRNLRNLDQAGISEAAVDTVIGKITDPEQVRRARLFPYQVWSAYAHAPSDNWARALGKTLDLTTQNIPDLSGSLSFLSLRSYDSATQPLGGEYGSAAMTAHAGERGV